MAITVSRGRTDDVLDAIIAVLRQYEAAHPQARIDLYRQNPVSVRLRIIAPDFAGHSRPQRSQAVWHYLGQLPEDVQGDISTVLLLTPDEAGRSFANMEFEDPLPSKL